jgi:iron complex transport system ATP-binding protein
MRLYGRSCGDLSDLCRKEKENSFVITLEAIDISTGYPGEQGAASNLVQGFQLALKRGEVMAVIGANGTGKSSLLRVLAGLQSPLSGKVKWNQRDLSEIPSRERPRITAVLFREFSRVEGFTVSDLVSMGRQPYTGMFGKLRLEDHKEVGESLQKTGIEHLAKKQIGNLSDGEFQKAMLAKMLAQNAEIMLLDEPTTHLDLPSALEFIHLLKRRAKTDQKTVVFSSHDLSLVFKLADKILLLDGKGSWAVGTPEEISQHHLMCGFLRTNEVKVENGNLIFDFKAS